MVHVTWSTNVLFLSHSGRILLLISTLCYDKHRGIDNQTMTRALQSLRQIIPPEALVWTIGLIGLALTDPDTQGVLDLCLFKQLGFEGCPGCGLGHSVAYLLHGDLGRSLETHPLGPFAVGVLCMRILSLVRDTTRFRAFQSQP